MFLTRQRSNLASCYLVNRFLDQVMRWVSVHKHSARWLYLHELFLPDQSCQEWPGMKTNAGKRWRLTRHTGKRGQTPSQGLWVTECTLLFCYHASYYISYQTKVSLPNTAQNEQCGWMVLKGLKVHWHTGRNQLKSSRTVEFVICLAGLITKSEHLAENAAYGLVISTTQELFRGTFKKINTFLDLWSNMKFHL